MKRRCAALRERYSYHHVVVFILTFMSYVLLHVTRKSFSTVKSVMQASWMPTNHTKYPSIYPPKIWDSVHFFHNENEAELFFGYLDTIFLFCYAVGLYISGAIGDRVNPRYLLSCGMMLSAVLVFLFGSIGPWLNVYSVYYYGVLWGLNGLVQSCGWPTVVTIMGNWFGKGSHGVVFGVWSANASVGNIFGSLLVSALLRYGFEYSMMAAAFLQLLGGVVMLLCLVEHPRVVGLHSPDPIAQCHNTEHPPSSRLPGRQRRIRVNNSNVTPDDDDDSKSLLRDCKLENSSTDSQSSYGSRSTNYDSIAITRGVLSTPVEGKKKRGKAINFFKALLIPGVVVYSLSYGCLKLVNYSLFFWLPFYLHNKYSWASPEESDKLSTLYDVGGIFGGAIGGLISDRLGKRSPVVVIMLTVAIGMIFIYQWFGSTPVMNGVLMVIAGFFIGGPANLESSAIAADLGKQSALHDNKEALSTVTGIVDGTGSVGAAIGQTLLVIIQEKTHRWSWVFYFLMASLGCSALFLIDLFRRDMWELMKALRKKFTRQANS